MRRPITYAELILVGLLVIGGFQLVPHLYRFVSDKVSIEVKLK
jgi:hypothetical protein